MLSEDPCVKERMSRILAIAHNHVFNNIVKTSLGPNITIIAKEAITSSIRNIIAEKFAVPHDLLNEVASIISEQDWNHDIGEHAAVKLVVLRGLQISGLHFSKDLYESKFWMTLACKEFVRLNWADDPEKSPFHDLFLRASNDLGDYESKQLILSRSDKQKIQQRAETLLKELTKQYLSIMASTYEQTPTTGNEEHLNFAVA